MLEDVFRRPHKADKFDPEPIQAAVEDLEDDVTVEAVEKTDLVVVTVLDHSPDTAARIGNAIAYAYVLSNLKQQAAETAQKFGPEHPVTRQLQEASSACGTPGLRFRTGRSPDFGAGSVQVVEHAYPATEQKKPKKDYVTYGSLGGGFLGSFLIIFLLELMDPTFRGPEDMRLIPGVPSLGAVSRKTWRRKRRLPSDDPCPPAVMSVAHQLRAVLASRPGARRIFFAAADRSPANAALVRSLALCLSRVNANGENPANVLGRADLRGAAWGAGSSDPQERRSLTDFVRGEAGAKDVVRPVDGSPALVALEEGRGGKGRGSLKAGRSLFPFEPGKSRAFLDEVSRDRVYVLVSGPDYLRRAEFLS